jgi:hypothetical protein
MWPLQLYVDPDVTFGKKKVRIDPLIIEAVNLFKPEVQDVIWEYTGEDQ